MEWYTWRGATLIMGGILLNVILCGALFRPLVSFKEQRKHKKYLRSLQRFSRASSCRELNHNGVCDHPLGEEAECVFCQQNKADTPPVTRSLQQIPTFLDFDSVFKQYSEFRGGRRNNSTSANQVHKTVPLPTKQELKVVVGGVKLMLVVAVGVWCCSCCCDGFCWTGCCGCGGCCGWGWLLWL